MNRGTDLIKQCTCVAVLLVSGLSVFAAAPVPSEVVAYKKAGDAELKLHVFNPAGHATSDQRPCMVFFFGGGWVGGRPAQFFKLCDEFSQLGFVAVSAEYRTKHGHGTTPFECVKDGKSVVRYLRAHAAELGIDPARIIASGGSAGAHVACCAAVISGHEEEGEDVGVSSVPNGLILYNPVLDTTEKGYGAEKLVGKETVLSPCHNVRSGMPPMVVMAGTADKTTPFENAERFVRLMKEKGNECSLIPFEGKGHGISSAGKQGADSYTKAFEASVKFLQTNGLMP